MAEVISILSDTDEAAEAAVAAATRDLAAGLPVAIPTETVYGLAADATNPKAIAAIYEAKGRPRFNPLICHMAGLVMAERYADFDPLSRRLASAFWPGPLTLILPLKPDSGIHALATAGLDTVGIRVPQGFAGKVIAAFDRPLAAPSANRSGRISPTTAAHVEADLGDRIGLIIDGGACGVGVESTIVKVEDGRLRLLRPGGIAAQAIEAVAAMPLERHAGESRAAIEAPGMLESHYAPDAAVRLGARSVARSEVLLNFAGQTIAGMEEARLVLDLSPAGRLDEAAAHLFDYLKQADLGGDATIAVAPIPDEGLGEAINDRLARAAAPRPAQG